MRITIILFMMFLYGFPTHILAQDKTVKPGFSLNKLTTNDDIALLSSGTVAYFINNKGNGGYNEATGNAGFYYPVGTDLTLIFQDGFVWAGKVENPDGGDPLLKSGGATYRGGLQAGPILSEGNNDGDVYVPPVAANADDSQHKIYLIDNADLNSSDYQNWPSQYGAPVDDNGDPLFIGDQVAYYVANDMDDSRTNSLYGSDPIGMEVQSTFWVYKGALGLGKMVFFNKKLINKSGLNVNDFYAGIWSDPDVGYAGDDLVGVDTLLNLSYAYNGDDFDEGAYLSDIPAVGYVGISNIQRSAFSYYINGGPVNLRDPELGEYSGTVALYNYMQGFDADGNPQLNGRGEETKFPFAGDPNNTSDTDLDGGAFLPDDRRMLFSFGPYDFNAGDTVEVTYALVVGDPQSNLTAITALREQAKLALKVIFEPVDIFNPPALVINQPFEPTSSGFEIAWTDAIESYTAQDFVFEGYEIRQLGQDYGGNPIDTLIAYFDVINDVTYVNDYIYDYSTGETNLEQVVNGLNTGIQRSITIDKDYFSTIPGQGLLNGRIYQYQISSVFVRRTGGLNPNDLIDIDNPNHVKMPVNIEVMPEYQSDFPPLMPITGDTLIVEKIKGPTGSQIRPVVVYPDSVENGTYQIAFESTEAGLVFQLYNTILQYETLISSPEHPLGSIKPYFKGILFEFDVPAPGFSDFLAVQNAAGVLAPPSYAAFAFNASGFPSFGPHNLAGTTEIYPGAADRPASGMQSTNASRWGIHTIPSSSDFSYTYFLSNVLRGNNPAELGVYDYEMRFTADSSVAWMAYSSGAIVKVPFELWNIGINTPGDASDDYRMIPWVLDEDGNDLFNMLEVDHTISGEANDPYTDRIYWRQPVDKTPGQSGYQEWVDSLDAGSDYYYGNEVMARMTLVNFNGGTVPGGPYSATMVEPGTVFRMNTNKPLSELDSFIVYLDYSIRTDVNDQQVPIEFKVGQNYPNPFNPVTNIAYQIPKLSDVNLSVYNVLGQLVYTKGIRNQQPGYYTFNLDFTSMASGVYFYQISAGNFIQTRKMLLLK